MTLSGISEAFSLAAVVPVIYTLNKPEEVLNISFYGDFLNQFQIINEKEIIIATVVIFSLLNFVSALVRILNLWAYSKYAAKVGHDISKELYRSIVYLPYLDQIKLKSSDEIASLTAYVNNTIIVIETFLHVVSSVFIGIFLFAILLIVNFKIAFYTTIFFSLAYLIISLLSRKKLINNSFKLTKYEARIINDIQEGMGGIREISLRSNHNMLLDKFSNNDLKLRLLKAENALIGRFPRYLLESVGIISLSIALIYLYLNNIPIEQIITVVGAFALGAQRLLPTLQQLYFGYANFKSLSKSITTVFDKIANYKTKSEFNFAKSKNFNFKRSIQLKNVFFRYNKEDEFVLKNINLQIFKGETVGFVGKTGGGKSTLIDIIMGLLPPEKGSVLIDNIDIYKPENIEFLNSWKDSIGHVPQSLFMLNSNIEENIAFDFSRKKLIYIN